MAMPARLYPKVIGVPTVSVVVSRGATTSEFTPATQAVDPVGSMARSPGSLVLNSNGVSDTLLAASMGVTVFGPGSVTKAMGSRTPVAEAMTGDGVGVEQGNGLMRLELT